MFFNESFYIDFGKSSSSFLLSRIRLFALSENLVLRLYKKECKRLFVCYKVFNYDNSSTRRGEGIMVVYCAALAGPIIKHFAVSYMNRKAESIFDKNKIFLLVCGGIFFVFFSRIAGLSHYITKMREGKNIKEKLLGNTISTQHIETNNDTEINKKGNYNVYCPSTHMIVHFDTGPNQFVQTDFLNSTPSQYKGIMQPSYEKAKIVSYYTGKQKDLDEMTNLLNKIATLKEQPIKNDAQIRRLNKMYFKIKNSLK
jgi:hypothetical protein